MSKYDTLRGAMGCKEDYNDKTKYGRVLKWRSDGAPMDKVSRQKKAKEIFERLRARGLNYVTKVQVRSSIRTDIFMMADGKFKSFEFPDDDKICVYVDMTALEA